MSAKKIAAAAALAARRGARRGYVDLETREGIAQRSLELMGDYRDRPAGQLEEQQGWHDLTPWRYRRGSCCAC